MKGPILLALEERVGLNYTHVVELDASQGDLTAAGLTQSIDLFPLKAGQRVVDVGWAIKTPFSGGSATALTATVGDTGTANRFLTSASLLGSASPVNNKAGDGAGFNQAGGIAYNAVDKVQINLTSVTANLNTLTAGVLQVFAKICDSAIIRSPIA